MKQLLITAIFVFSVLCMCKSAQASYYEDVETYFYVNQIFTGPQVIHIKQRLQMVEPNLPLANALLSRIEVIGKSRNGNGKMRLEVGGISSAVYPIFGTPALWTVSALETMQTIGIMSPTFDPGANAGMWLLRMGNDQNLIHLIRVYLKVWRP